MSACYGMSFQLWIQDSNQRPFHPMHCKNGPVKTPIQLCKWLTKVKSSCIGLFGTCEVPVSQQKNTSGCARCQGKPHVSLLGKSNCNLQGCWQREVDVHSGQWQVSESVLLVAHWHIFSRRHYYTINKRKQSKWCQLIAYGPGAQMQAKHHLCLKWDNDMNKMLSLYVYVHQILSLQICLIPASDHSEIPVCLQNPL